MPANAAAVLSVVPNTNLASVASVEVSGSGFTPNQLLFLKQCKQDECKSLLFASSDGSGNFGPLSVTVESFFLSEEFSIVNCLPENTCRIVGTSQGATASAEAPISFANPDPSAPSIITRATIETPLGGAIQDVATLAGPTGNPPPTGTVVFTAYGPDDPFCEGEEVFTDSGDLAGAVATSFSDPFFPQAPGVYRWVVAYSGDDNYSPVTSPCNSPGETSNVTRAQPFIVTQATPTATLGSSISDSATVLASGGLPMPTGTVSFSLYGPDNFLCSGDPVFTSGPHSLTVPINTVLSDPYVPEAPGVFRWVATYSGDDNYLPATAPCNLPSENSVVTTPADMTITTQATLIGFVGRPISDTATVEVATGLPVPGGTLVFRAYGPDTLCTGEPAFVSDEQPLAAGPPVTASSGPFVPLVQGTYLWVVSYSGDDNYPPLTTECGAPNEESNVISLSTDVSIDKVCPSEVAAGQTYQCTLTVATSENPATNLLVTDNLDEGVVLVQAPTGGGFDCVVQASDPEIICAKTLLTDPSTITYTVLVPANTPSGTSISNTAVVSANQEPDGFNNSETVTTQVTNDGPACTITGTEMSEILGGTRGPDVICGLGGDDVLLGRGGDDILLGGSGDDTLVGGPGDDNLFGGPGKDSLHGGTGRDLADGGTGSDSCTAETRVSCERRGPFSLRGPGFSDTVRQSLIWLVVHAREWAFEPS